MEMLEQQTLLQKIVENYPEDEFLKADGFDDAVIGVEPNELRLIYSIQKCIDILCIDMTLEEAVEHFWYNVAGSYVGEKTPIWCEDHYA